MYATAALVLVLLLLLLTGTFVPVMGFAFSAIAWILVILLALFLIVTPILSLFESRELKILRKKERQLLTMINVLFI